MEWEVTHHFLHMFHLVPRWDFAVLFEQSLCWLRNLNQFWLVPGELLRIEATIENGSEIGLGLGHVGVEGCAEVRLRYKSCTIR